MNKRKGLISFILTLLILLLGIGGYQLLSQQQEEVEAPPPSPVLRSVKLQRFQPTDAPHNIAVDGRLTPFERVDLFARVSGILLPTSRKLKKGMAFNKGDLLFDIDRKQAEYQLYALRANLLNAITLIMPDLKLDHPAAYTAWKTYLDQFDSEQAISPLPQVDEERVKYYVAARNIYNLYYNIKSMEEGMKDYQIYAPFSGIIAQATVFPGALVNPGQLLGTLISSYLFELEAAVNEADLSAIKVGNSVTLYSRDADRNWTGTVRRIGQQIDPVTQNVPIYIQVKGQELREGMFLNGTLRAAPLQAVYPIAQAAIVNQKYVFTVQDSMVQLQALDIVSRDEQAVYVRNFDPESWVVSSQTGGLFAGQKIAPVFENRNAGE